MGDMAGSENPTTPGWYDDPDGVHKHQAYWDGARWTGETRGPLEVPVLEIVITSLWVLIFFSSALDILLEMHGADAFVVSAPLAPLVGFILYRLFRKPPPQQKQGLLSIRIGGLAFFALLFSGLAPEPVGPWLVGAAGVVATAFGVVGVVRGRTESASIVSSVVGLVMGVGWVYAAVATSF